MQEVGGDLQGASTDCGQCVVPAGRPGRRHRGRQLPREAQVRRTQRQVAKPVLRRLAVDRRCAQRSLGNSGIAVRSDISCECGHAGGRWSGERSRSAAVATQLADLGPRGCG